MKFRNYGCSKSGDLPIQLRSFTKPTSGQISEVKGFANETLARCPLKGLKKCDCEIAWLATATYGAILKEFS